MRFKNLSPNQNRGNTTENQQYHQQAVLNDVRNTTLRRFFVSIGLGLVNVQIASEILYEEKNHQSPNQPLTK